MKRAALLILVILTTLAATVLLWQIRSVLLLLVAAIALGATMRPIPEFMQRIKVPPSLGAILMVLVIFASLLLFLGISGYAIGEEAPKLLRALETRYASLQQEWRAASGWQHTIAENLPESFSAGDLIVALEGAVQESADDAAVPVLDAAPEAEGEAQSTTVPSTGTATTAAIATAAPEDVRTNAMLRLIVGTTGSLAGLLGQFVILVFISLYWTLEHQWFERLWISLLPARVRQPARSTWRSVERDVGAHIRSEVLQSVVAGILVYVAMRLLGIEYPVLLAWISGLAWLIPVVGWMFALIVTILIGLLSTPLIALIAAGFILTVYAVLEFVVEPRLDVRRNAGSILGLLLAMIMLNAFGILGLLLASPLAVAINSAFTSWSVATRVKSSPAVSSREALQEKLDRLHNAMTAHENEEKVNALPRRTRSLYGRLEGLVRESEEYLPKLTEDENTA